MKSALLKKRLDGMDGVIADFWTYLLDGKEESIECIVVSAKNQPEEVEKILGTISDTLEPGKEIIYQAVQFQNKIHASYKRQDVGNLETQVFKSMAKCMEKFLKAIRELQLVSKSLEIDLSTSIPAVKVKLEIKTGLLDSAKRKMFKEKALTMISDDIVYGIENDKQNTFITLEFAAVITGITVIIPIEEEYDEEDQ